MEWLSLRSIVVTHRYDRHDSPSRKKNSLGSSELFRATLGQSPELDIGGARYVLPTIIGRFDDGRPRSPTDDGGYFGGCGLAPPAPWPQHSRRHPRRADPRGGALRIGVLHHLQGKNHPTSRARRTTTMDASGGRASHGRSPATAGAAIALRALQRAPPPAGEDETAAGAASGFVSPGISRELDFSSPQAPAGNTIPP